jgi:L-lactate dehydrogenase complex protein LldF
MQVALLVPCCIDMFYPHIGIAALELLGKLSVDVVYPPELSLNGSCSNVCPVKIDIHEQIYGWREVMEENDQIQVVKKEAMRAAGEVLRHPALYQIATTTLSTALEVLPHFAIYNRLDPWGKHRDVPDAARETFHAWHRNHHSQTNEKDERAS